MRLARPFGQAMYSAVFKIILAILSVLRTASGSCQSQFVMSSQTSLQFKEPDSAQKSQYLSVYPTTNNTSTIKSKFYVDHCVEERSKTEPFELWMNSIFQQPH